MSAKTRGGEPKTERYRPTKEDVAARVAYKYSGQSGLYAYVASVGKAVRCPVCTSRRGWREVWECGVCGGKHHRLNMLEPAHANYALKFWAGTTDAYPKA